MTYIIEDYLDGKRLTSYPAIGTTLDVNKLADFFRELCPFQVRYTNDLHNWLSAIKLRFWCEANCVGYWSDSIILSDGQRVKYTICHFQYESDAAFFKLQLP